MVNYSISYKNPLSRLVDIEIVVDNLSVPNIDFQLSAWRPGRYELQNYAANIKGFQAYDVNGKKLNFSKKNRNCWRVNSLSSPQIFVRYQYYAHQMDAGGCWLDDTQLYLNFICCLMYIPEKIGEQCCLSLSLPNGYNIACGIPNKNNMLIADNFYHLADSPMIASNALERFSFDCRNIPFYIWIQGNNFLDSEKLITHFKKYTEAQIAMMGDFPEKDYHYLFQFLPYGHYHGVEHRNSTVITLGPSEKIPEEKYADLLGISSHELFHAWNIVKIRPKEMMPYDFTKENYFETGFIAEGFTTYYGDLFLVRSGVISEEEYLKELNKTLKKHFDNFGNFNMSLAESSIDLWVDGYSSGIPNRKVSIYVKGCIVALLLDLEIRKRSSGNKSLDDLMRVLWNDFGKKEKGYSIQDIIDASNKIAGEDMEDFFNECVFGRTDLKDRLENILAYIGCVLEEKESSSEIEKNYGFKYSAKNIVEVIVPNSPAEVILSVGDEVISSNVTSNILKCIINRGGRKIEVSMDKSTEEKYFSEYYIIKKTDASKENIQKFKNWLKT